MADLKPALALEEMKKLGVAEVRKAYDRLSTDYNRILDGNLVFCHHCNTFKAARSFYNNRSYKSGLFPICRECVLDIIVITDKKTKAQVEDKEATLRILRMMDRPYISSVYMSEKELVELNNGERNRNYIFSGYIKTISSLPQYVNRTWVDSEFDEEEETTTTTNNRTARKEIKKIFGDGFTERDYVFLQDSYDDFRARTQVDSISQEIYVKQICMSLLEIDKDRKNGKDVTNKLKSLDTLMNSANLQPRQNVDNAATDSLTFSQLLEKWEEHDPILTPSDDFKDVDGIWKYIQTWFGWICKVLGIKNAYNSLYEEEFNKYTVNKENIIVDEDVSEDIYETIFGKTE